jgi:hypothetical protein
VRSDLKHKVNYNAKIPRFQLIRRRRAKRGVWPYNYASYKRLEPYCYTLRTFACFSLGESAKLPSTCHSETNMVHVVRMAEEKPSALAKLPWLATHVPLLEPQVPMDPGQL